MNQKQLELIFGKESSGATPRERAMTSNTLWVRSDAQLAVKEFPHSPPVNATGLYMSSLEALQVFGIEFLWKVIDRWEGNAVIIYSKDEPAASIKALFHKSGLSIAEIIKDASPYAILKEEDISNAMDDSTKTSMRIICVLAPVLNFDPRKIGVFPVEQVIPYPFLNKSNH